ncbi:MAG: ATP-grasp domain-containing protein [Bacteroidetes bacterium]|nr:ATP-grasp domain-containing protein [Bacteroidota bacterium]
MKEQLYILFCESPINPNKVDEDFEDQLNSAKEAGFVPLLFNMEDLLNPERNKHATKRIQVRNEPVKILYRGWMLTPDQYTSLYKNLSSKNYILINTPDEYRNCHYLPDSLKFIESKTPKTVFEKYDNEYSMDKLLEKTKIFGQNPVIIKDYVKSEKHHWESACFVKNASDTSVLRQAIQKLIELRGNNLNEGIIVREFIELNKLTFHSKSGMPLTEEYRLFFCHGKLIEVYDYWEEGEYKQAKPNTAAFEEIAGHVESNFFSMDIARQKDGKFIIIELGDGQVAGLPDSADKHLFYRKLLTCLY